MSLRSNLRDDFPTGWWRSAGWWVKDWRAGMRLVLLVVAPVTLVGQMRQVLRHRAEPSKLARTSFDDWGASCLFYVIAVGLMCWTATTGFWSTAGTSSVFVAGALVWLAINAAVTATVMVVLCRSRLRSKEVWSQIDFVDRHLPRNDRPPETIEEYDAQRMKLRA